MSSPPHRSPPSPPPTTSAETPPSPSSSVDQVKSPSTPFMTPMASPKFNPSPLRIEIPQSPPPPPLSEDEEPAPSVTVTIENKFSRDDSMIIRKVIGDGAARVVESGRKTRREEQPREAHVGVAGARMDEPKRASEAPQPKRASEAPQPKKGSEAQQPKRGSEARRVSEERPVIRAAAPARRATVRRGDLVLRVLAAALTVVATAFMCGDRTKGWDGDSFQRYGEFRYLVAVNLIALVYSGFQIFVKIYRLITKRYILRHPNRYYFDLTMDQVFAYLLMSASSAAASINDIWVERFGSDEFTNKANKSIIVSFFAFFVFALSSIISAYTVFSL